jgi:hypothetical protein
MNTLITILEEEKELNDLLSHSNCPKDIHEKFVKLFQKQEYQNTQKFLDKNEVLSLHDCYIVHFSQKKKLNDYQIVMELESISIYSKDQQIGYFKNSRLEIQSKESLRDVQGRCILNFLIDESNKEIAFLYLNNNKRKVLGIQYENISLIKGEKILYNEIFQNNIIEQILK